AHAVADEVRADRGRRRNPPPLTALERQTTPRPLAPRAGIEPALAAAEPGTVEDDARRHARAAVGDELAVGKLGQRLGPRGVGRAEDPPGRVVDLVRLATPAIRNSRVDERERRIGEAARDLLRGDRVAVPFARNELGRLDLLLAGAPLASPDIDAAEQNGTVLVAEVAQEPPEPLRSAAASVGDDAHALADACKARRGGQLLRRRQWMPSRI